MMNCTLTNICPECDDSSLSKAANVLGILTFAFGLFLSLTAFVTITRNADNEIRDLFRALDRTDKYLADVNDYLVQLQTDRDAIIKEMQPTVTSIYKEFLHARDDIRDHLKEFAPGITQEYPKPPSSEDNSPASPEVRHHNHVNTCQGPVRSSSLWVGAKWWYREKDIVAKMTRLESCRQHFNATQLTLIARKMEQQKAEVELLHRAVDNLNPKFSGKRR